MLNKKVVMLYEILSPLTHMMGTKGNEAVINREPVMTSYGKRYIPVLSGNAIRHNLIRESGVNFIFDLLNIEELTNIDQLNFLYTGGSLSESSISESIEKIKMLYEKIPLFKLLGGSLRNQIISGMLMVGRGIMLCQENETKLEKYLPKEYLEIMPENLLSAEMFIGNYQYTRGDIIKQKQNKIKLKTKNVLFDDIQKEEKEKSNLMIYNGQSVISGALFINEFILQDVKEIDLGAFFASILFWQENNGTLGGSGRIGHGKIKINLLTDFPVNKYVNIYKEHLVKQGKENIQKFLDFLFPEKKEKEKKNAKS